jgi:hypothetical protein
MKGKVVSARSRNRRGILGAQAIALAGTGAVLAAVLAGPAVAEPGGGVGYARDSDRDGFSDGSLHESPEVGGRQGLDPAGTGGGRGDTDADGVPDRSDNVVGRDADADGVRDDVDARPGPDFDRNRDGVPDQWAGRGPAGPAKPASPSLDVGPKPREQSFYGVSGGWAGLRGTIGLSEDGRQVHLGAGIGRPGASIGTIDKAPDGLNANGKAGITISQGNKGSLKGKINVSPDLDVSGSVGAEISIDLGNGNKLELSGSLAYKDGTWEFSTSTSRTVPLDKRREVTVGDDGKAKVKLPSKPSPWKAKPDVDLDASITANGTFDIGKALESLGLVDPAPTRQPNSVGGPDERAKAPNSSGSPDDRDTSNAKPGTASKAGKIGPADNPGNGGDRGRASYGGRAANSSGSPDDRDSRNGFGGPTASRTGSASSSGKIGPADNPGNGGDRGSSSSSGSSGSGRSGSSASSSSKSGSSGTSGSGKAGSGASSSGKSGPADNPGNGGDRGRSSYGGHHSSSYDGSKNSSGSPDDRDVDNGNTGGSGAGCTCV